VRTQAIAVFLTGWLLAGDAYGQSSIAAEPGTYWSADFSASGLVSPGIGGPTTAVGGRGSVALVRSTNVPADLRTTCVGAKVTFAQGWSEFGSATGLRREHWFVAGPVWEMHDRTEGIFVSLHPFAGAKRSAWPRPDAGSVDVSSIAFGARLSLGVGITPIGGNEAAIRFFDITYLITPADPVSPHRVVFSAGLDISRRLRR